jgi:glycosyltransferase involved in cell wall biosynthesis
MVQPLKVLQLLPAMESGGVEQGTLEVANELVRRGHRSLVISAGGRMAEPLTNGGSKGICWPIGKKSPATLALIPRLRRLILDERPDILHPRSRLPAWIALAAWKSLPARLRPGFITTVHGLYSVKYYSSIMTRGERVIAVSRTAREYILANYPNCPDNRIRVIHRGVDAQHYHPGYRPTCHWQDDWYQQFPETRNKSLLILPGRLTRLKGHLAFLEMIDALHRQHPDIHALIVGGIDPKRQAYARSLHDFVAQRNLGDRVTFTGVRDDLREILAIGQIAYSLSSHPESFGRTSLEALALGTPLIGYNHGGVGELLANLLPEGGIEMDNQERLCDRTLEFLQNPPIPKENQRFTLQAMLDSTLALYQEVAAWRR